MRVYESKRDFCYRLALELLEEGLLNAVDCRNDGILLKQVSTLIETRLTDYNLILKNAILE